MSLEELLRSAYGVAMTPLPGPPGIDPEMVGRLRAAMPSFSVPPLPQAPEWMQRYLMERGLLPKDMPGYGGLLERLQRSPERPAMQPSAMQGVRG